MRYYENESRNDTEETNIENTMEPATKSGKVVNAKYVKLRKESSPMAGAHCLLSMGTKVTVIGEEGSYYKVKYKNFPEAYIAKNLVAIDEK